MKEYKAKLVYVQEGQAPVVVDIEDEVILKRSAEAFSVVCQTDSGSYSLGVFDSTVSGGEGHARLGWDGDKLFIQDLGSKNGTFLLLGGKQMPLRGWGPKKHGKKHPSEHVPIKKSTDILLGSLKFRVEVKKESPQIVQQHIHGDYIRDGASKVAIHDSVVQRSNIGSDIKVNDNVEELGEKIQVSVGEAVGQAVGVSVRKEAEWLDKRNAHRAKVLRKGQLEIKGITEEMARKMEKHFNELKKRLPYPSDMTKKRLSVILHYSCPRCKTSVGDVKDRKWLRWVNLTIGAAMAGVGVGTLNAEVGIKGVKKIFSDFSREPFSNLSKKGFMLTNEEKDRMINLLRDKHILEKVHFCPACNSWVCSECFNAEKMMCSKDC